VAYDPKGKAPGAIHINTGGPSRKIAVPGMPDPSSTCADCRLATADRENPRDHCAKHDHVIRTEAP
jgi:hypothetical protein